MIDAVGDVLAALAAATYPSPSVLNAPDFALLLWGSHGEQAQFAVFDTGRVVVDVENAPDADFAAEASASWLTVLYPHIAHAIARVSLCAPIPQPAPLAWGTLPAFAYFDEVRATGVYAIFTDQSRIWVAPTNAMAALDALLGTIAGYQLGVTVATVTAVETPRGAVYLNPTIAAPAAILSSGRYLPALTISGTTFRLLQSPTAHKNTATHAAAAAAKYLASVVAEQTRTGRVCRHQ